MTSPALPSDRDGPWELPPEMEDRWRRLVSAFGLIEGSEDNPIGSGILRNPKIFSDKQRKILIETLGLQRRSTPIPPGTYTIDTLPPLTFEEFKMYLPINTRAYGVRGFTEIVRRDLDKLSGRLFEDGRYPKTGRSGDQIDQQTRSILELCGSSRTPGILEP